MEHNAFSPRYTLSQPRKRPTLLPDQEHATANAQPEVQKKKTPPPRPRRQDLFHSPPPILPVRNPLRSPSGIVLPTRSPLRVMEIWDPEIGNYVRRMPEGGFVGIVNDRIGSGGGTFGVPTDLANQNGRRVFSGERSRLILPGEEITLRTNPTASSSQAQGIGRSRSVNDSRINHSDNENATSLRAPTPRLLNVNAIDRPLSHPAASGPGPGQEFSRIIHETISNLRQSYLNSLHINEFETELRTDGEVFTNARPSTPTGQNAPDTAPTPPPPPPSTPLHRNITHPSASSSTQQNSARNFSLPTYGSPSVKEQQQFALESRSISGPLHLPSTGDRWDLHDGNDDGGATTPTTPKQKTPRRPLRRVRSRSVNLGRIAEASEVPGMPTRRLGWWDRMGEVGSAGDAGHGRIREEEVAGRDSGLDVEAGQVTKTAAAAAATATTKPKRKVWREVEDVEEDAIEEKKGEEEEKEEACGRCKSIRRALARNPLCCVDREQLHRLCFKCWREALADGLKTEDRAEWLCCVVCGRELLSIDAKRLASRGTILRYKVKSVACMLHDSLPQSFGGKILDERD